MLRFRPVPVWRLCAALSIRTGGAWLLLSALLLAVTSVRAQTGSGRSAKDTLVESIRVDPGGAELSAATAAQARAFLDDRTKPARDRLEVKIAFEQARLKRRDFATHDGRLQAHTEHAEELIRDFPDQPEGYGYLLSLAKAEAPGKARRMAETVLASSAPEPLKRGARRVLARLNLAGKPLRLAGADAAVNAARGQPLALYVWTARSAGLKEAVRRLAAERRDFTFIGINLDADLAAARAAAAGLPGTQLYDGGGLDGPLARQLQLTMTAALYLVDAEGIIREVDAHRDPAAGAEQFVRGGRR